MLQLFQVTVTADFLNNPQPYSGVAHLGESRPPKTVGGGSLDANPLERFSQNLIRGVGVQMLPMVVRVAAGE